MHEALRRHAVAAADEDTAAALERYERQAREARVSTGMALAAEIARALTNIETDPGDGLFAGQTRKQVTRLAGQLHAGLATLGARRLPTLGARALPRPERAT